MRAQTASTSLTFSLDRSFRVVITRAREIVSREDILQHIQAKVRAGVLGWTELFDARDVILDLSAEDLPVIARAMLDAMAGSTPAKTAVVTNSAFVYGLARSYAELTKKDNPHFEVFTDYPEAWNWCIASDVAPRALNRDGGGRGPT